MKRLQHTLMLAFLALSITPLILLALFFIQSHSNSLKAQSSTQLALLRDSKKEQIIDYFDARYLEVKSFSLSELATSSGGRFYGFVAAFHQLGQSPQQTQQTAIARYKKNPSQTQLSELAKENDRYRLLHKRYDWAFKQYLKRSDFSDILIVDINGNVVYSEQKDALFAANLLTEQWKNTAAGQAFSTIKAKYKTQKRTNVKQHVVFSDFKQTKEGLAEAWFATAIMQQDYLHSFVLFKLPNTALANIVKQMPSELKNIHSLLIQEENNAVSPTFTNGHQTSIDTIIARAREGKTEVDSVINSSKQAILAAYTSFEVLNKNWVLILQLPKEQAFAQIHQLETIFILVMLVAILIVIVASHLLSNSITAPLLRLTWAAEQVSAGDLEQKITSTDRQDEIGRLAISFARMQRSIRDKLTLINQQNKKLEQNIALIQQKNDALQQTDRMKDEFLATTSYELRTPLHGMIGLAETMLASTDGTLQENQQAQLQLIISSGQRLSNLVDDLLDYHKIRNGTIDIASQAVDAATIIRLVIELSRHQIAAKPVRIIHQIPIDLPQARADEQRLEQVLYNLIGNAIKHTDEGKIIISAIEIDQALRIQVVDTGQGICPDQLDAIFEPLSQGSHFSAEHQSAHLGLSISKQLIEIMGGQLYVSSQPMVGTTFSFTLPIATQEDKAKARLANQLHFATPRPYINPVNIDTLPDNPDGPFILVVDDDALNRQILEHFLRLEGYRVKTSKNGRHAIELVSQEKPALILLDVMMPELNGYDVCAHLREQYSQASLPIIMLSALGQTHDKVKGFDVGANDYLIKPFNKYELKSRIRAYIDASWVVQERASNQKLRDEIQVKESLECNLLNIQQHFLTLLNHAPEPLLGIEKNGAIGYVNQACRDFFQRSSEQLLSCQLSDFIGKSSLQLLLKSDTCLHNEKEPIAFNLSDKTITIKLNVIALAQSGSLYKLLILNIDNKASDQSTQTLKQLEQAIDTISDFAVSGDSKALQQLRRLDHNLTQVVNNINDHKINKDDILRDVLVKAMTHALDFWQQSTGKNKFELAEESGLWRVYLDRSTLQTRTLDKYLHRETVPKSPRWRTVISTIDFVLTKSSQETKQRSDLILLKDRLQSLISR